MELFAKLFGSLLVFAYHCFDPIEAAVSPDSVTGQGPGLLKLGKISLDGSKIQANASKHSALSWGHALELEQQLKEEVARLMAMALC